MIYYMINIIIRPMDNFGNQAIYKYIAAIEAVIMSAIVFCLILLILKLFYSNISMVRFRLISLIASLPILLYILSIGVTHESALLDEAYYLSFLIMLITYCSIFLFNYKKINIKKFRQFATIAAGVLLFFIVVFILQLTVKWFNIDAFPMFYLFLNILLFVFMWKNIIAEGANNLLSMNKSFFDEYNITQREKEVIGLIREGMSNSEIAKALFVSEKTVANHVYNIFKKLNITSRFELIVMIKK